jgi:hypothetical protein
MKSNSNTKFLVLFIIIISILSIFTVTTYAASTSKIYSKSEKDEYISPIAGGFFVLRGGKKLFRFYRPMNDTCNEPDLHLRTLDVNGTLSPFEIKNLTIPRFNFCRLNNTKTSPDYIQLSKLKGENPDFFYIFYYNISDTDFDLPFGRFIAQVNLDGEVIGYELLYTAFYV